MATNFLELSPSEKLATSDDIGLLTGEFHLLNLDTYNESDPDSATAYLLDKRIEQDDCIFIVSSKLMDEQHLSLKQMPVFAINHEANDWKLGKYNGDDLLTSTETFKGGSSVDSFAFDGSNWQIDGFGTPMASMSQIPTIDNTLTVSQTTTFTDWVCSPEGTSIYWNSDDNRWVFSYLGDGYDSTATDRLAVEAVSADGITPILTATRTRTDITGYRLGSQSDKPIAPAGNYALKDEVPAKVSDLTNDAGYITDETEFKTWKSDNPVVLGAVNASTAKPSGGIIIGSGAKIDGANYSNSIAIGNAAKANALGSIAVGSDIAVSGQGSAQLGHSSTALTAQNTFRFRDTVVVNGNGKIPSAGLDKAFVDKTGDTMTGGLTVPGLTVGSRVSGSTVGENSVAEGSSITASGDYSHAEGSSTTASGSYSHVEGYSTTASGYYSHAEGYSTTAESYASHAEGDTTVATAAASHAEGSGTIARNDAEHAQGRYNVSHVGRTNAEQTIHSIGVGTVNARANAVEVMCDGKMFVKGIGGYDGTNPTASGVKDVATIINADTSVFSVGSGTDSAVQRQTSASVVGLPVESNSAISLNSVAEGGGNVAGLKGYRYTNTGTVGNSLTFESEPVGWSVGDMVSVINKSKYPDVATIESIEGNVVTFTAPLNIGAEFIDESDFDSKCAYVSAKPDKGDVDLGAGAHAEGVRTRAINTVAHAEGRDTVASGQYSHAEGRGTSAKNYIAHAEGHDTVAEGMTSHAEGYTTAAYGNNSHSEGRETETSGANSHAENYRTSASGENSHVEGAQSRTGGADKPLPVAVFTNTGYAAHAEGNGTWATGSSSHAEGYSTVASALAAHAEGNQTVASGQNSHASGLKSVAEGYASTAMGRSAHALHDRSFVWSGYDSDIQYQSKRDGTFCVNPVPSNGSSDLATGFWIGNKTLSAIISDAIAAALQGLATDGIVVDGTTYKLMPAEQVSQLTQRVASMEQDMSNIRQSLQSAMN